MEKLLQKSTAAIFAASGFLFGRLDGLFYALLTFVAMDYLTGILSAASSKTLSSSVGFRGLWKKMMIFCLVAMGHLLDVYVLGTGSILQSAVEGFYLANEGISILENAGKLGLPLPQKLKAALLQLRETEEETEEENKNE